MSSRGEIRKDFESLLSAVFSRFAENEISEIVGIIFLCNMREKLSCFAENHGVRIQPIDRDEISATMSFYNEF